MLRVLKCATTRTVKKSYFNTKHQCCGSMFILSGSKLFGAQKLEQINVEKISLFFGLHEGLSSHNSPLSLLVLGPEPTAPTEF
jgi:hypothetical protein